MRASASLWRTQDAYCARMFPAVSDSPRPMSSLTSALVAVRRVRLTSGCSLAKRFKIAERLAPRPAAFRPIDQPLVYSSQNLLIARPSELPLKGTAGHIPLMGGPRPAPPPGGYRCVGLVSKLLSSSLKTEPARRFRTRLWRSLLASALVVSSFISSRCWAITAFASTSKASRGSYHR